MQYVTNTRGVDTLYAMKETYSTVWKGMTENQEYTNGDYFYGFFLIHNESPSLLVAYLELGMKTQGMRIIDWLPWYLKGAFKTSPLNLILMCIILNLLQFLKWHLNTSLEFELSS